MDGLRRRSQTTLEHGEREADDEAAPLLALGLESLGAVHLLADVRRDLLVQGGLGVRQVVSHDVGEAWREQAAVPSNLTSCSFIDPAHQVRGIRSRWQCLRRLALVPSETVGVEQAHEQLEVLLLAVVRRRGEEQEVLRAWGMATRPSHAAALRLLDLVAGAAVAESLWASSKTTRSQSGGVVEARLEVLVSGELVEPGDQEVGVGERVARQRRLDAVAGQEGEVEVELLGELRLPLLDEAAGRDDEAATQVAADDELADEEPGHDRLAGAGVVGEQEAQRLAREHLLVDGGDLVRQRFDEAGAHRDVRVEEVGEVDALRFARRA